LNNRVEPPTKLERLEIPIVRDGLMANPFGIIDPETPKNSALKPLFKTCLRFCLCWMLLGLPTVLFCMPANGDSSGETSFVSHTTGKSYAMQHLAPLSIRKVFPEDEQIRQTVLQLYETGEVSLTADDGNVFRVRYLPTSDSGYMLHLIAGKRKIVGYIDVVSNWTERCPKPPFGNTHDGFQIRKSWRNKYRGMGTTLLSLAMGLTKYIRGDRDFYALSVIHDNLPFYGRYHFGYIEHMTDFQKQLYAMGVNLWTHSLPPVGIQRKSPLNVWERWKNRMVSLSG